MSEQLVSHAKGNPATAYRYFCVSKIRVYKQRYIATLIITYFMSINGLTMIVS